MLSRKICNVLKEYAEIDTKTFYLFQKYCLPENKYIAILRHPKEIIISGYLYHMTTHKEGWSKIPNGWYYGACIFCTDDGTLYSTRFDDDLLYENAFYVNLALNLSRPMPYYNKLKSMSKIDGIVYEMNTVARLTIDGMYKWGHYHKPNVLALKLEDLIYNHDAAISKLCHFLCIDDASIEIIVERCRKHNLIYQNKNAINNLHVTNTALNKQRYKEHWNDTLEQAFYETFPGNVLEKLGYDDQA